MHSCIFLYMDTKLNISSNEREDMTTLEKLEAVLILRTWQRDAMRKLQLEKVAFFEALINELRR